MCCFNAKDRIKYFVVINILYANIFSIQEKYKEECMKKLSGMKTISFLLAGLMTLGSFSPLVSAQETETKVVDFEPAEEVRVIVELEEEPLIETATLENTSVDELDEDTIKERTDEITQEQSQVKAEIEEKDLALETGEEYTAAMNGFAATVKSNNIEEIQKLDSVKAVHIQEGYARPEMKPSMGTSKELIGLNQMANNLDYTGKGTVVAVLDTGVDHTHKDFNPDNFDSSQVKLTEEGVKALIAEEGLKGEFKSLKVPYAYDYHDNDTNAIENKDEQHGMHVAGTVGANGKPDEGGIVGVAPNTQILAMKVFSDSPNVPWVYTDTVLKAIDDSIKLGADAINLSLGHRAGFSNENYDTAQRAMYQKAMENGIVCAIAAGNDRNSNYNSGLQYQANPDQGVVGSPAALEESLAVASFNNTHTYVRLLKSSADPTRLIHTTTYPDSDYPLMAEMKDIVDVGHGAPSGYEGKDVEGKIVLAQRGTDQGDGSYASYTEKKNQAVAAGAAGLVIYNHEQGGDALMNMLIDPPHTIPVVFIGRSDGLFLKENKGQVALAEPDFVISPQANTMAIDSSWGPTTDLRMKPEVLAPGANIYSTQNGDSYTLMSGTSMATPHVAGALAVLRQYLNESPNFSGLSQAEKAELSKIIITNTAEPKLNPQGNYYSVNQQGAGMINLPDATSTPVYLRATGTNDTSKDAKLEIRDKLEGSFKVDLELTNVSDEDVTYSLDQSLLSEEVNDKGFLTENTIKVEASNDLEGDVKVPAKSTKTFSFTVNYNNAPKNQFLTGFIHLRDVNGTQPNLTVPVLGFNGDWSEPDILDGMIGFEEANYFNFARFAGVDNNPDILPLVEIDGNKTVVFGPKRGVMPILTPLRNADSINFKIETLDKDLIVDKLTVKSVYKTTSDWWHTFSTWYGESRDGRVKEGDLYKYVIEAKINSPGAQVQRNEYPVTIDTTAPKLELVSYDPATRDLVVRGEDALAGLNRIWVYSPKANQWQNMIIEKISDNEVVGRLTIPENYGDYIWICTEDRVYNFYEFDYTLDNPVVENPDPEESEDIIGGPENTEDGQDQVKDLARINVNQPKWLDKISQYTRDQNGNRISRKGQPIPFVGEILNYTNIEKVILEEINPHASKGQEVLWTKEVPLKDLIKQDNGSYKFSTTIQPQREDLVEIRITVIDDGREAGISHKFWLDETSPVLDNLKVKVDGTKAKVDFFMSDNMNYIELQEHIIMNYDPNGKPIFNYFQTIDSKDNGYEHIYVDPVEAEFTEELPLKEGKNTFYFNGWDKVDNFVEFALVVDSLTGEVKVYDSWALENEIDFDDKDDTEEPEDTEKPNLPENPNLPTRPTRPSNPRPNEDKTEDFDEDNKGEVKPDVDQEEPTKKPGERNEISGANRYETSIEISKANFDKAETVVIVSGDTYPDALSAAPLASKFKAPILLVGQGTSKISEDLLKEIERLGAKEVILIGGENSVPSIYNSLGDLRVERIAGDNRYETSEKILDLVLEGSNKDRLIVASGSNFADSLSISSYAGMNTYGILLVDESLSPRAERAMGEVKAVSIIGGPASVSKEVEDQIEGLNPSTSRIAGANRYETSSKIAKSLFPKADKALIASGQSYPDALAGSVMASKLEAPILLVERDRLPKEIESYLDQEQIKDIYILGGENTISKELREILFQD